MSHATLDRVAMTCAELWGGNRKTTRSVELPGIAAWVYSNPVDGADVGGDLHYLSVCRHGILSRVALADVSGHGPAVSSMAEALHGLMREHIEEWDQTDFVTALNLAFHGVIDTNTYATAGVLGFYRTLRKLVFTNAGHLPPLWYRRADRAWGWLEHLGGAREGRVAGLPVGMIEGTVYRQTVVTVDPFDMLVLYTDGVTEAQDPSGLELGLDRLMGWAQRLPVHSPEAAGTALLDLLGAFRKGPPRDDETLIVLQILEGQDDASTLARLCGNDPRGCRLSTADLSSGPRALLGGAQL